VRTKNAAVVQDSFSNSTYSCTRLERLLVGWSLLQQCRHSTGRSAPLILRPPHPMWDAVHATAARATSATGVCKVTVMGAAWQTNNGIRGQGRGQCQYCREARLPGRLLSAVCWLLSDCLAVLFLGRKVGVAKYLWPLPDLLTGHLETCFQEDSQAGQPEAGRVRLWFGSVGRR
jgi:hypothetical protein